MNSRNQRGHRQGSGQESRQDSNFSRRNRDESPNQWTAYGRSDSEKKDRGSFRADQTDWTGTSRGGRSNDAPRDYDTSRDARTRDGDQDRSNSMNPYPHSYSEYDTRRDMETRRFGAHEGQGYLYDRSHEDHSDSRELYRPSFDDSARTSPGAEQTRQPSYSGRGPKGFKRSDERIKEEVCEMLTRDHSVDAEDIDVEVTDGEVTLTGTVSERRMKHLAEDIAERALGVKDVINNVRVKRENTSSDTESESLTGDRTTTGKKSVSGSSSSTGKSNH